VKFWWGGVVVLARRKVVLARRAMTPTTRAVTMTTRAVMEREERTRNPTLAEREYGIARKRKRRVNAVNVKRSAMLYNWVYFGTATLVH
jgi:hypothetical protein